MKIEFTGKVIRVMPFQSFDSGFTKQDVIIELAGGGDYPDQIQITYMKDKTSLLDPLNEGDHIYGDAYVSGRSWLKEGGNEDERRWFNSFNGISIEKAQSHTPVKEQAEADRAAFDETGDDLPF